MSRDSQEAMCGALVDEWVRCGVGVASISPGSRSTPLALALAQGASEGRLMLHVHHDERSAAFFALGVAKASGVPAVILCTSGTAAANFYPAVIEAFEARVPLIVCTADRPPELRGTGAGQTVDQVKIYGGFVRWSAEVPVAEDRADSNPYWRSLACRAYAEATTPQCGPIHLNLSFREPFQLANDQQVSDQKFSTAGRPDGAPWNPTLAGSMFPSQDAIDDLYGAVTSCARGVVLAGWGSGASSDAVLGFSAAAGWPVLADPLSNLRVPGSISTYDVALRSDEFGDAQRPDAILHLGAALTSKAARTWTSASGARQILIDPQGLWANPSRVPLARVACDADALLVAVTARLSARQPARQIENAWVHAWSESERNSRHRIDAFSDVSGVEILVARDLPSALPDGATLVVGASMPVRDLDAVMAPRDHLRVLANRGASGIDGFVSSALGIASTTAGPSVAMMGDLTFLHDAGGLAGASRRDLDVVLVVIDNDGGGIFSFLPQADLAPKDFDAVFGTPHGLDLVAIAKSYGAEAVRVETSKDATCAVRNAISSGGVWVVVVTSDRKGNLHAHRNLSKFVAGT